MFTCNMILERETKGAARYQEVDEKGNVKDIGQGACIGTLYIRKSALPTPLPEAISVSVSSLD